MANLEFKQYYRKNVVPALMKEFNYSSIMQVGRVEKIVLNIGLGSKAVADKKLVDKALEDMTAIAGQKAMVTKTKKSVAGFKIRDGWPIGVKVTLRGDNMYNFLERLITVSLPRVRDFRGYSAKSFDGRGNLSIGIPEYIAFPEIDYENVSQMLGMDIVIVTSSKTNKEAHKLLKLLHFPFTD
ncbi:MAG: 50S ribosomal protein L5 [Legionellales bacterium]|jgi:large subunit ribosomal protein L5|nr:50S ribosomal protein L5 [Legionellales bacterium]